MELRSVGLIDSLAPNDSRRLPHKPQYEGPNRRDRYRVKSDAKILVKFKVTCPLGVYQSSQIGTMRNRSRSGIFFEAFGDYQPGMTVEVVFPYDPAKSSLERSQQAEVVRVEEIQGSLKNGVAVKLLRLS